MIVLAYVGNNEGHGLLPPLLAGITRWAQKGATHSDVTHVESLLDGNWYSARIGSSSLKDKGVRIRDNVRLDPKSWRAYHVPTFSANSAEAWHAMNNGKKYDLVGAVSTVLWLIYKPNDAYICVEAVANPQNIVDAAQMTPAEFIAHCMSLDGAKDVTELFFSKKEANE